MVNVLFAGYNALHSKDFTYHVQEGHNCYLFLLLHTKGLFMMGEEFVEYPAGSVVLFGPNQRRCYKAAEETYSNDWVRFETKELYITDFPVLGKPFLVSDPEYYHRLMQLITWESAFSGVTSEEAISNLFRILFLKLHEDSKKILVGLDTKEINLLRKEIYNSPNYPWSIQMMASKLHISGGYLQRIYKEQFGISCMEDVIESRIHRAKEYLIYTQKSIYEIAQDCGYHNVEHFCRQFKKKTLVAPSHYRVQSNMPVVKTNQAHRSVTRNEL